MEISRQSTGKRALRLVASVALLSWCVSVRLPAETSASEWLAPQLDVAVLLALFALFAPHAAWRIPRAWAWTLGALLLIVRLGRIADGISLRYLDRRFHVVSDIPLLPEFARLALSTLGPLRFAAALVVLCAALVITWLSSLYALRTLGDALSARTVGNVYLAALAALVVIGFAAPSGTVFASSVTPRAIDELEQCLTARGWFDDPAHAAERRVFSERFMSRQAQLRAASSTLARSAKVDVHIVLVEAYGHAVQSTRAYATVLTPSYHTFEATLASAGFAMCTQFVRATIFGGSSWLTHATLETSVPMYDQFEYELFLNQHEVTALAKIFRGAGYRAISVKPATTRDSPLAAIYGFDLEYKARDFGYRGPSFGWALMPDQFVLERVAELELHEPRKPLFAEYALISSHFPFNPHPQFVDDWSALGDGRVFGALPAVQFHEPQGVISTAALGYVSSIAYDLRVTSEFVARYVRGDALVLILGDHQPVAPVAGSDLSRATPLHVLSRRATLLQPFRDRGCVPGTRGDDTATPLAMEDLGSTLFTALSEGKR